MPPPQRPMPHASDGADQDRIAGAFARLNGAEPEDHEKEEDAILQELKSTMLRATELVGKLEASQAQEEGPGAGPNEQGEPENDNTGSPSAGGIP